jgi:hypothetical protein
LKYCARFNVICGAPYLKLTNGLRTLQEIRAKTFRVIGDGLRMYKERSDRFDHTRAK